MYRYYVQTGTCFGKSYTARNDAEGIAYGKGYADAKGWKHYHIMRFGRVK